MRKALKWLGIVLGGLVGLSLAVVILTFDAVGAYIYVKQYHNGYLQMRTKYQLLQ